MTSYVRHVLVLAMLTAVAAPPTLAQFKPKLPKIGGGGKAPATASQSTSRSPTFNDRVIEITDPRIDALLAGYGAEFAALDAADRKHASVRTAYEDENKQHPARLKEYEAKRKAWQQCQDTHGESGPGDRRQ